MGRFRLICGGKNAYFIDLYSLLPKCEIFALRVGGFRTLSAPSRFSRQAIGARLREVRLALDIPRDDFATALGVNPATYPKYEQGKFTPNSEALSHFRKMGFSVDWLLTGDGPMRGFSRSQTQVSAGLREGPTLDPVLIGQIIDGISAAYREEGARIADIQIGHIAGPIYDDLVRITDPGERRGALRYAMDRLRRDLRTAAADPTSGKRQA